MRKYRIMVIDDEPMNLRLIEAWLKPLGYEVFTAGDGLRGLDVILANKPHLILLDVMMPGMNGYSTLSKLKENEATSKTPVVMLTAVDFELNKELALQLGACAYLTKPVEKADLLKTITRFVHA